MPIAKAEKVKDKSKVKHSCPTCDAKAWAKAGSRLVCGDCDEAMVGEGV
jgi:ribosomal protein S27AE